MGDVSLPGGSSRLLPPEQTALAGFGIVVTAERRAAEFTAALERRGAQVTAAPVTATLMKPDDAALRQATDALLYRQPDIVVITTAVGLRNWLCGVDADQEQAVLSMLKASRILARGPKARAAIRAAGLVEEWVAASETTRAVVDRLLTENLAGRRVAVQLHGGDTEEALTLLTGAGADVVTLPVYRVMPAPDDAAVNDAVRAVADARVDAVVFSSAPGSHAFLQVAHRIGRHADVVAALRGPVLAASIGPVTAEPLEAVGVTPLVPPRFRLPILVRTLTDHLASGGGRAVRTEAGVLVARGPVATLDGVRLPLSPVPLALLRMLVRHPGAVVTRPQLLAAMPAAADLHAVEVGVARLRTGIGVPGIVDTVVGEGYRLAATALGGPDAAPPAGGLDTGMHAAG